LLVPGHNGEANAVNGGLVKDPHDPFAVDRLDSGLLDGRLGSDTFVMVLRYADLRAVARNWHTFTSDAPFRVPIPSEHDVRPVRQLPIETDPPDHGDYRRIVLKPFSAAVAAANRPEVELIAGALLDDALDRGRLEVVRSFALPIQSRGLALMLGRPQEEAEEWISWGTHVFRDFHDSEGGHASALDRYIARATDAALARPGEGDDFFGLLARSEFRGRRLTREEIIGFANLTFAGGRDTVINSIANCLYYLAQHDEVFQRLRTEPELLEPAIEEFLRYFSPLTHIGRIVRSETHLLGRKLTPTRRSRSASRPPTGTDRPSTAPASA
jgi:cytochrome P450